MRRQPAKWIANNPKAYDEGVESYWLNAFSSPWTPWQKIILKFLHAKDDPQKLKVVFNTLFGEVWEDRGDVADEDTMLARREDYGTNADGSPVEVPEGVLVLTCGVDTQDNRLEYEVVGHGHYGETWGIKKGYIMGKPDTPEVWQRLDDVIDHVYKFKDSERGLKISITCVDSGGHYTQEVYEACRARKNKRVFAIKGKGGDGIPFVSPPSKVPIRDNKKITCWLYTLGVDAGKAAIMSALKVQEAGPKYCHFPNGESYGYDTYYFNGLLSEHLVYDANKKQPWIWKKIPGHERNETLDCRNYALAAFKALPVSLDAVDRRLKEARGKRAAGVVATAPSPQIRRPAQPRKQGGLDSYYDNW